MKLVNFAAAALFALAPIASSLAAGTVPDDGRPYRVVWDNFHDGFDAESSDAKWFHFQVETYRGDSGIVTTSPHGLRVRAPGTNPMTGEPAYTQTLGQEAVNGGLVGWLDRVKWLAYMNHYSSHGFPGFDTAEGREVACEAVMGGRTYGTEFHPFGDRVSNPQDDTRLAMTAMNTIDFETYMVFDFFFTNETIYVVYERLPIGRDQLGNYGAFSYVIPVASRKPWDSHRVKIGYDKAGDTAHWYLDGKEVYTVNHIGFRLDDNRYMTIDHGGVDEPLSLNQLNCGMGMFTILDSAQPLGTSLVKLSSQPDLYYDPRSGDPVMDGDGFFADEQSLESNRLFGQGAAFWMQRYSVSSLPTGRH